MANHSPKPDNYVGKKTWDEAMAGEKAVKPEAKPDGDRKAPEQKKNEARGNGSGEASK